MDGFYWCQGAIARIINSEKAEFNGETYTIEDEVGGILCLVKEDSP